MTQPTRRSLLRGSVAFAAVAAEKAFKRIGEIFASIR